jgi:hypothetical protein
MMPILMAMEQRRRRRRRSRAARIHGFPPHEEAFLDQIKSAEEEEGEEEEEEGKRRGIGIIKEKGGPPRSPWPVAFLSPQIAWMNIWIVYSFLQIGFMQCVDPWHTLLRWQQTANKMWGFSGLLPRFPFVFLPLLLSFCLWPPAFAKLCASQAQKNLSFLLLLLLLLLLVDAFIAFIVVLVVVVVVAMRHGR